VILLDTHVLIWMSSDPGRISTKARHQIVEARRDTGIAVASITLWELAWLAEHQRILYAGSVESFVRETISRVVVKSLSPEIVAVAAHMPDNYPKDPSDRLIGSTAIVSGMPLVTADEKIRSSGIVECVW
jgi:PIN domain nuclease of toxin-antitoxin system